VFTNSEFLKKQIWGGFCFLGFLNMLLLYVALPGLGWYYLYGVILLSILGLAYGALAREPKLWLVFASFTLFFFLPVIWLFLHSSAPENFYTNMFNIFMLYLRNL
jgi:hypothetical protein